MVLATGARYRRLDVENLGAFEATSVHYWASPLEAKLCANQEVALVGAGNSAGQAAVYLASQGAKVYMLVRRASLTETMSRYLVDRISSLANIEVVTGATISALEGRDGVLDAVRWQQRATGQEVRREINHLFLFIGADRTRIGLRVPASLSTPRASFSQDRRQARDAMRWKRPVSGVFAIGDVRAKSIKRVAAAVGEGAQVVAALHSYLASADPNLAGNPALPDRAAE